MSLYLCAPDKHKTCDRGDICQRWCRLTTVPEFSVDGRALSEEEIEQIEDAIREANEPGIRIGKARNE